MRILVVEDEPDLLETLEVSLKEAGYAVDTAPDGEEGLEKAEMWDYDAIVLDIMLPGMNGWEVLERLRKTKKTPVLFLTARDGLDDRIRGLDSGADDFVTKPFELTEVLARLRAIVRRSKGASQSLIEIGSVRVDTAKRSVTCSGGPVELTAREFSLVAFLAVNQGKVISRSELYDHLFDENETSLSNLLDVHVYNVRKKLGKGFIKTRRGHGYVVE